MKPVKTKDLAKVAEITKNFPTWWRKLNKRTFWDKLKGKKEPNFFEFYSDFCNGRADDIFYFPLVATWCNITGEKFVWNKDALTASKNAVRRQWHHSCSLYPINAETNSVAPGNYLILQAIIEGYFDADRQPKMTLED